MPRNGSGTYTRNNGTHTGTTTWVQDQTAGVKILASVHDTHDQDIADAITYSISKDGQTVPIANLPMGTYRHTGVGNGVARTDYCALGQAQDQAYLWGGTAGGAVDAITLTLTPVITAYTAGMTIRFKASGTNTTAVTLNVNGVGAISIRKRAGAEVLVGGELILGQIVTVVYNGTFWRLQESNNNYAAVEGWAYFATTPLLSIDPSALTDPDAILCARVIDTLINTLLNQRVIK